MDLLSPLIRLEITVHLVCRDILSEARVGRLAGGVRLEKDLRHTEVELFVLDFVQSDIDFIL